MSLAASIWLQHAVRARRSFVCPCPDCCPATARSKVFSEADEGEVLAWMRQLEDEEGLSPLWEVFFQIAAYPVPQVRHVQD